MYTSHSPTYTTNNSILYNQSTQTNDNYEILYARLLHAESRVEALTSQLDGLPSSVQIASAQCRVLETKLSQNKSNFELKYNQLIDDKVYYIVCLYNML